jgi:hypothetical protein
MSYAHEYANFSTWLDENLVPEYAAEFRKAGNQCFTSNDIYDKKDLGIYFKRGLQSMRDPIPASVYEIAGRAAKSRLPSESS